MTLALFAGQGRLPALLLESCLAHGPRPLIVELEGVPSSAAGGAPDLTFRIETLGTLIAELRAKGVTRMCLAGAIRRPALDPARIDAATMPLVPQLMAAFAEGDDGALRRVLGIFEAAGIEILGPDVLMPGLLPPPGWMGHAPAPEDLPGITSDAGRAAQCVAALGALDIGQGCVVSNGQVIALEAFPGTDWMLRSLAAGHDGVAGGLLYKAPKPDQDRRVDLPAIGPETVRGAAEAGLGGIVVEHGGVMLLDADEIGQLCSRYGLYLWIRPKEDAA